MTQFSDSDGMPLKLEDMQTLYAALSTAEELLRKNPARDVRLCRSKEGYWFFLTDGMTLHEAKDANLLSLTLGNR
jgi:hypothetical protein